MLFDRAMLTDVAATIASKKDGTFDRASAVAWAHEWTRPLELDEYSRGPLVIVDESGNLIDGWHRIGGLLLWAESEGVDDVEIPVVQIPDAVGERLWGSSLTDEDYVALVEKYGGTPANPWAD